MDLITLLKRRFLVHFGGKGETEKTRLAFAALAEEIRKRGPEWYDPWSNQAGGSFPKAIASFRDLAGVVGRGLARLDDKLAAARIEADIVDGWLGKKGLSIAKLGFEALDAEFSPRGGDTIAAIDSAFRKRVEVFRSPELEGLARGYDQCRRIAALCRFDFAVILEPFTAKAGNYRTASAEGMADIIDDLRFLVEGIDLGASTAAVLDALANDTGGKESAPSMVLPQIGALLGDSLSPTRLWAVARAASMKPESTLKIWTEHYDLRKPIVDALMSDFKEKRSTRLERMAAADLDAKKQAVFGDATLLEVTGYTGDRNELFAGHHLPRFDRLLPFSIVKTFMTTLFAEVVNEPVGAFSLAFESESDEFKRAFGDALGRLASIGPRIVTFEEDIVSPARSVLPECIKALTGSFLDSAGKRKAAKAIEEANERADSIVQDSLSAAGDLHVCLEKILVDFKSIHPLLVANARTMNTEHPETVEALATASATLFAVVKLLRGFSVDLRQAREAVR
ncbi:MAG: hypothetical protein WCQ50_08360 [Spirochaetota bacterium]